MDILGYFPSLAQICKHDFLFNCHGFLQILETEITILNNAFCSALQIADGYILRKFSSNIN